MVVRVTPSTEGFGLIEMLVVVAVLSIMAVGTSLLATRSGNDLTRATDMLRSDAIATRHIAMLSGLDHALTFSGDGWQVSRKSGEGWRNLSTRKPRAVSFETVQSNWILQSDGGTSEIKVRIVSAAGDAVVCNSVAARGLECR